MSVRLVRQASDTPNITNRDDSRMTRFAYGGINGVMKGYGNELSHSIHGSKFVLNSGCIVLHGWEVLVDSWELDLSTVVSTQYHTVYLEVSVASELATIKSTYQTGAFPSIEAGNDLTTYPNGTARLPLYTFVVTNGVISSVTRKFSYLSYYGDRLDDIEQRLSRLGFKEGGVILPESSPGNTYSSDTNTLKRQGNYVIGEYVLRWSRYSPLYYSSGIASLIIGTIPGDFLPSQDTDIYLVYEGTLRATTTSNLTMSKTLSAYISAETGEIKVKSAPELPSEYVYVLSSATIIFGYEAAPLT